MQLTVALGVAHALKSVSELLRLHVLFEDFALLVKVFDSFCGVISAPTPAAISKVGRADF